MRTAQKAAQQPFQRAVCRQPELSSSGTAARVRPQDFRCVLPARSQLGSRPSCVYTLGNDASQLHSLPSAVQSQLSLQACCTISVQYQRLRLQAHSCSSRMQLSLCRCCCRPGWTGCCTCRSSQPARRPTRTARPARRAAWTPSSAQTAALSRTATQRQTTTACKGDALTPTKVCCCQPSAWSPS